MLVGGAGPACVGKILGGCGTYYIRMYVRKRRGSAIITSYKVWVVRYIIIMASKIRHLSSNIMCACLQ